MDPKALVQPFARLGMGKSAILGGSFLGVLALIYLLVSQAASPQMTPLYQAMDPQDSNRVADILGSQGITFELKDGQVHVPRTALLKARMLLAESGVSSGTSIGYEVFDKSDVLGSTHFLQNVNLLRALEGELSRTIQSIQDVAHARVHIVMPERQLFSREKRVPSAAVVLRMRHGKALESEQVKAIQYLVASSVPDMKVGKVSVLDDRGVLLASGNQRDGGKSPSEIEERRAVYEARISRIVESILEQSLGPGSVRAEVSADFDHDRVTEQSERFDPDGQVIRSQQSSNDKSSSGSGGNNQATSIQQEMPTIQKSSGSGDQQTSDAEKNAETTNYEISKTVRTAVRDMGVVKRLSVAVLVDGTYTKGEGGKTDYAERSADEIDKIKRLVQAAVGYNEERGDVVDVVNLRFKRPDVPEAEEGGVMQMLSPDQWQRLLELVILGVFLLLLFLLGVKPMVRQIYAPKEDAAGGANGAAGASADGTSAGGEGASGQGASGEGADGSGGDGELSPEEVKKMRGWEGLPEDELADLVNQFVESDPERAASVLRIWMKE